MKYDAINDLIFTDAGSAVGSVKGGYAAAVVAYEESGDDHILMLSPDSADLNMEKFSAGEIITLSLVTASGRDSYALTQAVIAAVDTEHNLLHLAQSIYQGDVTGDKQIGFERRAVSGYTDAASGGASAFRVTLAGAGSDDVLQPGRKLYTRAGDGPLVANAIAGTDGSYLFLRSAAPGITAIYIGPSTVFLRTAGAEADDGSLACSGEHNFVAGEASGASGALNTVIGVGSHASGVDNTVSGDVASATGNGNRVNGNGSHAVGTDNRIDDAMGIAVGNKNRIHAQGAFALGDGNVLSGINAIAVGWINRILGYGAIAAGAMHVIQGKWAFVAGFRNTVRAVSCFVFGRYADIPDTIDNKNGFFFHGGTKLRNGTALAVRTLKAAPNPRYAAGGAESEFIEENAFSTEYRGRLKAISQTIAEAGNVDLDHDQYARWELSGAGTVTPQLVNWQDGDRGEIILDSSVTTLVLPASWAVPDGNAAALAASPGPRLIEVRREFGAVYAKTLIPW